MKSERSAMAGFNCPNDVFVQRQQNGYTDRPCATNQVSHVELDMHVATSNFDAKSGKKSVPRFVADGRVYIDVDNMAHVCLHVSQKHSSAWSEDHVRVAA